MLHSTQTDHPTQPSETKYCHLFPKTRRFVAKNPEYPFDHADAPRLSIPLIRNYP